MTTDEIANKIQEFVTLAQACPEKFQETCFEVLLRDFLTKTRRVESKETGEDSNGITPGEENDKGAGGGQGDLVETDLHVKARKFMKSQGIVLDEINQVFYKEDGGIELLVDDIRANTAAESQLRIALLQALENAIQSGDFEFDGEEVRKECQERKCYDVANFSSNFKKNKDLFEAFEKYDRTAPKIRLGTEGRKALANLIKALQ